MTKSEPPRPREISPQAFGLTLDGRQARVFELSSDSGVVARVTDFGATLVSLVAPARDGTRADVTLGFDDVSGYESDANQYFGCIAGRVANRIAKGRFTLDGEEYNLATNNDPNHLHGGVRGFGQRLWQVREALATDEKSWVTLEYTSPDGEEGYPGTVRAAVTYALEGTELTVRYSATSDAATPLNLTQHSYWNLAGHGAETVLDHKLQILARTHTATDDTLIPTGELAPVSDTPLDFQKPVRIGERIAALDDTPALGYDHNYVLERRGLNDDRSILAARLSHPVSGRILEIWTTEPGLQFYSGNFLNGQAGKGGARYARRSAVCLETQHFPDSVNRPEFPSTILRPGQTYRHETIHRFLTD